MTCIIIAAKTWTEQRDAIERALRRTGYVLVAIDPRDSSQEVDLYCTTMPIRCRACRQIVEFDGRQSFLERPGCDRVFWYPLRCAKCGAPPGGDS